MIFAKKITMNSSVKLKIKDESTCSLINLSTESTLKELVDEIRKVTDIGNSDINLLTGFPPKPINMSLNLTLSQAKIVSGDCIILQKINNCDNKRLKLAIEEEPVNHNEKIEEEPIVVENHVTSNTLHIDSLIENQRRISASILTKQTIPSDNSCLFASVYYCLNNASLNGFDSDNERQLVCATLLSQPGKFDRAFLEDKSPEVYCKWIMDTNRWGGSIELCILSSLHSVEIDVVNVNTDRIDRFGEDCDYFHKILIIYDGIHYDSLALEDVNSGELVTLFPISDKEVIAKAQQLARELQSSRQYTDLHGFSIVCRDCHCLMVGQSAVVQHANATGHSNFGEIEPS